MPWSAEHMHLKKTHELLYCTTCIMLHRGVRKEISSFSLFLLSLSLPSLSSFSLFLLSLSSFSLFLLSLPSLSLFLLSLPSLSSFYLFLLSLSIPSLSSFSLFLLSLSPIPLFYRVLVVSAVSAGLSIGQVGLQSRGPQP